MCPRGVCSHGVCPRGVCPRDVHVCRRFLMLWYFQSFAVILCFISYTENPQILIYLPVYMYTYVVLMSFHLNKKQYSWWKYCMICSTTSLNKFVDIFYLFHTILEPQHLQNKLPYSGHVNSTMYTVCVLVFETCASKAFFNISTAFSLAIFSQFTLCWHWTCIFMLPWSWAYSLNAWR